MTKPYFTLEGREEWNRRNRLLNFSSKTQINTIQTIEHSKEGEIQKKEKEQEPTLLYIYGSMHAKDSYIKTL